jgi:hypothetical protein
VGSHIARGAAEQWFANVCGVSESAARQALAIADRLGELPATQERLRSGKLSVAQAAQVTAGASVDPSAEPRLLLVAERKGMRELCTEREVCEIPGVGPVPVSHARRVLSHGLFELVISDGVDVQTVVSTTRHVRNALRIAIEDAA